MSDNYRQFEQRKQDHIDIVLEKPIQTKKLNDLNDYQLIHEALPDLNFDEISLSTSQLGQTVKTPFLVSSMTAGHKGAVNINQALMAACSQSNWLMGVGSQRRELSDLNAANEWKSLIQDFPNVRLLSNLGIAQLCQTPTDDIKRLTSNINARGLIIHLNSLQECIQPEGTPQFKGSFLAIEKLVKTLEIPVILKETGSGFSLPTLKRLNNIGIHAIDVSGLGGTHWGRVEGFRAADDSKQAQAAQIFKNWGVSSMQSIINAQTIKTDFELWGSGGVRSGLDAAKLLALGANTIGLAKPLLEAAIKGPNAVISTMQQFEYELKIALFCTGSKNITAIQEKHHDTKL